MSAALGDHFHHLGEKRTNAQINDRTKVVLSIETKPAGRLPARYARFDSDPIAGRHMCHALAHRENYTAGFVPERTLVFDRPGA